MYPGNLYRFQLLVLVLNGRSSVIGNSVDSIDGSVVLISVGNECIVGASMGGFVLDSIRVEDSAG